MESNTSTIQKTANNRYENVLLEVLDLLWDNNRSFIYSCRILNPINSLPMREEAFIALYSKKKLLKKKIMETSIEIIEKSKYKATYKLVDSSDNSLNSFESLTDEEELDLIEAGALRDIEVEEEAIADNMVVDLRNASIYLESTSSKENFIRLVPYYYYLVLMNKDFKRPVILMYLASIYGPFSMEIFDQEEVKEFLKLKSFEDSDDFFQRLDNWVMLSKNDYMAYDYNRRMWNSLIEKDAEICEYLYEHQYVESRGYYLPELEVWGFSKSHWPRI